MSVEIPTKVNKEAEEHLRALLKKVGQNVKTIMAFLTKYLGNLYENAFFNTLTGKKEQFNPLTVGKVKMYCCGVTPYGNTHIGHSRTFFLMIFCIELLSIMVTA